MTKAEEMVSIPLRFDLNRVPVELLDGIHRFHPATVRFECNGLEERECESWVSIPLRFDLNSIERQLEEAVRKFPSRYGSI